MRQLQRRELQADASGGGGGGCGRCRPTFGRNLLCCLLLQQQLLFIWQRVRGRAVACPWHPAVAQRRRQRAAAPRLAHAALAAAPARQALLLHAQHAILAQHRALGVKAGSQGPDVSRRRRRRGAGALPPAAHAAAARSCTAWQAMRRCADITEQRLALHTCVLNLGLLAPPPPGATASRRVILLAFSA